MNLDNKKALIIGIASNRSIATEIAKVLSANGAQLLLTYQGEKLKNRVEEIANEINQNIECFPCDLSSDKNIDDLAAFTKKKMG